MHRYLQYLLMQRKLHQGCNMCDNFSRQFHDMTCQFLASEPLENLQLPVLSSNSTCDLIPWTGGVLASEPLQDFQLTIHSSNGTCCRVPCTGWVLASEPLQDFQLTILSRYTCLFMQWTERVLSLVIHSSDPMHDLEVSVCSSSNTLQSASCPR